MGRLGSVRSLEWELPGGRLGSLEWELYTRGKAGVRRKVAGACGVPHREGATQRQAGFSHKVGGA